jgi:hypothetical protein
MKKGDKEMKKVLFPILAMILALGLATPVLAGPPLSATTVLNISPNPAILSGDTTADVTFTTTTTRTSDGNPVTAGNVQVQWASDGASNPVPSTYAGAITWVGFGAPKTPDSNGQTTWQEDLDGLFSAGTVVGIKAHFANAGSGYATHESAAIDLTVTGEAITVEKDYRYTNVCFEKDNDGDGQFNEDPIDGEDNDGDLLIDEDPVDCPDGTYLGDLLPMDGDYYLLKAVINKRDVVKSYNPGQYYAVSTVNVLVDVDMLTIEEDFSDCTDIGILNPVKGGGKVVIVQVGPDDEVAYQILDAKSSEVLIVDDVATVSLEDQKAGTTILMYVKFGPALKGEEWEGPYGPCVNTTSAWVVADPVEEDIVSDNAMLELVLKE